MADAFPFKRQNSPDISEEEYHEGLEFRNGEGEPRKTQHHLENASFPPSTPFSREVDLRIPPTTPIIRQEDTATHDPTKRDTRISASATKESQQKIAHISSRHQEDLPNFSGDEKIVAISGRNNSIPGSSSSDNSPVTEIGNEATDASKEFPDTDESQRLSRIDSAKQDVKNLKSATLGRMGKIFKIRPPTPRDHGKIANETNSRDDAASTEQQYGQNPSRKEKTNSLGRMLRLVDKDGTPRKLFSHPRTGSLTRFKKINSNAGNAASNSEESRNIFTRMLNQFRGRNPGGSNAEPNLQSANGQASSPKPSLGTRLMMSLSARGSSAGNDAAGGAGNDEASVERVAVEYTT